jgi:predicted secreted protein
MRRISADADRIEMSVGEKALLELEALGAAGYEWHAFAAAPLVVTEEPEKAQPRTIGGKVVQSFILEARKPGETRLRLTYGRSWDPKPAKERVIRVTID